MAKSIKKELESVDPADIAGKMLLTSAKVESAIEKAERDSSFLSTELHKKVTLHSLTAGDPLLVELSEELRGKLMEIWSRGTAASGSSKGGGDS